MIENKILAIDKRDWTPVKFGDVAKEPKESVKDAAAAGIKCVVGLEHIDPESVHLRRFAGIEESTTFTKRFATGDVLFGRRRAYLKKAAQATFDGICSGDITVMRAKGGLSPELLPFVVQNEKFFDYAIKHSAGGLSPRVKFKDLANYEFLLPPKEQQAELAELLWAMDEVIEKELDVVDSTKAMFDRKQKDFFALEKKFSKDKLGSLVSIKSGESPSKFTFAEKDTGIPFYKVKDMNYSIKYQRYAKEWVIPHPKKVIVPQSVIFPKRGAAIMTNKVRITNNECHVDTNTMALTIKDRTKLCPDFLYFFLLYKKLYKIVDTSQIPQINNVHINPYPIHLPPLHIQEEYCGMLNQILEANDDIENRISSSKQLQKSLINQVF